MLDDLTNNKDHKLEPNNRVYQKLKVVVVDVDAITAFNNSNAHQ